MLYKGKILWHGAKKEVENSKNPYLHQFINGLTEGPIEVNV
jgi:phospholipid/cholesterol/gamma-HCH transport system ATP-binding protein